MCQDLSRYVECKDTHLDTSYILEGREESQKISITMKDSKLPSIAEGTTYYGGGGQEVKRDQEHRRLGYGLQF